jgi:hypothetical protein
MVTTLEAPLTKERVLTREDVLRLIPKFKINGGRPLFYQDYLDREYVLGTIGDRGGGKSGSDAVISIVDFLIRNKPVWSNMRIAVDLLVDDESAREVGLSSGGIAHFESLPLEKGELLKLDEKYRNGCLVIEEINVQYSNVRRFMANTNIDFNEVCQQLRKFKTSLIYNVIDEMFIDSQLRALTDIFIRTYDTAFDKDAMRRHKKPGLDFCWQLYSMTGYLNGEQGRYAVTHKANKCYFRFAPWRGVYNDKQHQEKGIYSLNKRERDALAKQGLSVESSEEMEETMNEWQWLIDNVRKLKRSGIEYLEAHQLWQVLEIIEHGKTPQQVGVILPSLGITKHHQNKFGKWVFKIETFALEDDSNSLTQPAARN